LDWPRKIKLNCSEAVASRILGFRLLAHQLQLKGETIMNGTKTMTLAATAVLLLPLISMAQDSKNQGYLVDTYGNNIVTSPNSGLCWRTSDWTPARAGAQCDPVAPMVEAPVPKVVAAAPPPLPPKPATPPAPVPAPVKAATQSVGFSADALFAFDQSVLKPEGKALLDDFARRLTTTQYEGILVIGHTDRLGSNEYNQKLSERRAIAVKDYLVVKDVSAKRIKVEGTGKTQPVTKPDDCIGAQSVKVIACLQPDRRVHVEVTGTTAVITNP
jgi:OOP family OmpA-OmpF porin